MGAHLTAHADLQRLVSNAHGAAPRMLMVLHRECSRCSAANAVQRRIMWRTANAVRHVTFLK